MAEGKQTNAQSATSKRTPMTEITRTAALTALRDVESGVRQAVLNKKALVGTYKKQKKVPVYLPTPYQAYFGKIMQVSINGITICFPVNGKRYDVPKTFADEIERRRLAIEDINNKNRRMSDFKNNFEQNMGDIKI